MDSNKALHERVTFRNESLIAFYDKATPTGYPLHWHAAMELIMPIDGGYTVTCNNITWQLKAGDILIIQPNVPHQIAFSTIKRFICLASLMPLCSLKAYDSLRAILPPVLYLSPTTDPVLYTKIREQYYTISTEFASGEPTAEYAMVSAILQILSLIGKNASTLTTHPEQLSLEKDVSNQNIHVLCEYIHAHYMEKLTLEDAANICGFSQYHFDRLFKKHTGMPFYQYLSDVRLKNAVMLLSDENVSITEVSFKSGFTSISSFIRMFRIYYGCTPTEYRQQNTATAL